MAENAARKLGEPKVSTIRVREDVTAPEGKECRCMAGIPCDDSEPKPFETAPTVPAMAAVSFLGHSIWCALRVGKLTCDCDHFVATHTRKRNQRAPWKNEEQRSTPMSNAMLTKVIGFARTTWHDDGAEGETVHRLCDELERRLNPPATQAEQVQHDPSCARVLFNDACNCRSESVLAVFHDIRIKGWNCRSCMRFNGEEKEIQMACNACETERPRS